MADPSPKSDRFKPTMPAIPGVPAPAPEKPAEAEEKKPPAAPPLWADRKVQIGAGIALVFVIFLALLLPPLLHKEPLPAPIVLENPAPGGESSASTTAPPAAIDLPVAPGPVASPQDLAKPWSVVKFQMQLQTGERAPAQVLRLPTGSGNTAYWGFLSVAPYGRCELELVQDVARIAQDYGYRARHPMVVDSCTQSIYDPLSYGGTHGTWVRGQVVSGPGLRPPLAIEIIVEKGSVVATRSE
jgi:hypothetical protein